MNKGLKSAEKQVTRSKKIIMNDKFKIKFAPKSINFIFCLDFFVLILYNKIVEYLFVFRK